MPRQLLTSNRRPAPAVTSLRRPATASSSSLNSDRARGSTAVSGASTAVTLFDGRVPKPWAVGADTLVRATVDRQWVQHSGAATAAPTASSDRRTFESIELEKYWT